MTAAAEMEAVAVQNPRVKDAIYHVILSWPAGEHPTDDQAFECGLHALRAVGMQDHQYVFAIHRDTDNAHLHIAVNRVNPDSFKAVYPDRDYFKLDYAMRELELRFGWKHDSGPYAVQMRDGKPVIDWASKRPNTKGKIPTAARDMEVHADQESLFSYARGLPLATVKAAFKNAELTWAHLHEALAKHGLEIREKGQGFAIYDRHDPAITPIKASDMHEQLAKSRLVKRLGPFVARSAAPEQVAPVESHYDKYRPPVRDIQSEIDRMDGSPNTNVGPQARGAGVSVDQDTLFSYAKGLPLAAIKAALKKPDLNWAQLHLVLAKHGLDIREKGQGLAIYDRHDPAIAPIKASELYEPLGKARLVRRLGPYAAAPVFAEPTVGAGSSSGEYRQLKRDPQMREIRREARAKDRKGLRERYGLYKRSFVYRLLDPEAVRARFRALREEARRRRLQVRSTIPAAAQRKLLYSVIAFETMLAKDRLQREVRGERAILRADPTNRRLNYRQWVARQAMEGDEAAIVQLNGWRYSSGRQILTVIKDAGGGNGIRAIEQCDPKLAQLQLGIGFHVRVDGAVVYRREEEATGFIDHGPFLQVTAQDDQEILLAALQHATEKFDGAFELTGSDAFKAQAIKLLVDAKLRVVLTSKQQEAERKELQQQNRVVRKTSRPK